MQVLNLDDDIYYLLLLGMVAVGAHAYTLFNKRVDSVESSQRWRFLAHVPIQLITKKSNFNYGFIVYLILFELIYLILASSGSLVLMMYQVSGRDDLTGALSGNIAPSGAVPILASTAIILFSQIPPFSSFELALRGFAHQLARIPDGLKTVKQNITRSLKRNIKLSPPHSSVSGYSGATAGSQQPENGEAEKNLSAYKKIEGWIKSEFSGHEAEEFIRSYTNTLWLNEYTLETTGSIVWDGDESEEILRLFRTTEHEVSSLRSELESAAHKYSASSDKSNSPPNANNQHTTGNTTNRASGSGDSNDALSANANISQHGVVHWKSQKKNCMEIEERLILLFSLLIINQPDVDASEHPELNKILTEAHRSQIGQNSRHVLRAALYGGLWLVALFSGYYYIETELKNLTRQDPYASKAPFGEHVELRLEVSSKNAELYRWSGMDRGERDLKEKYYSSIFSKSNGALAKSLKECLLIIMIFVSSVAFALSSRTHHKRQRDWLLDDDSNKNRLIHPVQKYYLSCTFAAICSLSVIFAYYFVSLALIPAFEENKDLMTIDVIEPFLVFMPSLLLTAFIAWVCAYFALHVTDYFEHHFPKSSPEAQAQSASGQNGAASGQNDAASGQNDAASDSERSKPKRPKKESPGFFLKAKFWIFFAFWCSIVALTIDIYLAEIKSVWDLASTIFINFVGFGVLFSFYMRSINADQNTKNNEMEIEDANTEDRGSANSSGQTLGPLGPDDNTAGAESRFSGSGRQRDVPSPQTDPA